MSSPAQSRECVLGWVQGFEPGWPGLATAPPLPRLAARPPLRASGLVPPPPGPPPAAMPARRPPRAGATPSTAWPRPGRLLRNNGLQRSPTPCRDRRWLGLRTAGALLPLGGGRRARR